MSRSFELNFVELLIYALAIKIGGAERSGDTPEKSQEYQAKRIFRKDRRHRLTSNT